MIPTAPSTSAHALEKEIAAYGAMRTELMDVSAGKWVVFYHGQLQGTYRDFDEAASYAVEHFGRGPYLIRQVGEDEWILPASVAYIVSHEAA